MKFFILSVNYRLQVNNFLLFLDSTLERRNLISQTLPFFYRHSIIFGGLQDLFELRNLSQRLLKIRLILYTFSTPPFLCILSRFNCIVGRNIRRHLSGFINLLRLFFHLLLFTFFETLLLYLVLGFLAGGPLNLHCQILGCFGRCFFF